jgi:hypothetical protein
VRRLAGFFLALRRAAARTVFDRRVARRFTGKARGLGDLAAFRDDLRRHRMSEFWFVRNRSKGKGAHPLCLVLAVLDPQSDSESDDGVNGLRRVLL